MTGKSARIRILLYLGTGLVSFIAFFCAFKLWHADFLVPFGYAQYGDAIDPRTKELLFGTWFSNPNLAAPFGQDTLAITQLDALKWAVSWVLVELTRSPFLTQNLFEMIVPVLSAIAFLYAARRLGLSYAAAIPCAILFGNLYALYWRILAGHALVAAYWMTPLGCLALLQISRGMHVTRSRDGAVFLGTAILVGLESHYEAFFTGSLGLVAIVVGCIQLRSLRALWTGLTFLVVMVVSFAANASPTLLWLITHHERAYTYARQPVEAFLYSLSIGQLVLPNPSHRIPAFATWRQQFDVAFPALSNENAAATLGFVATIGLVLLVLALIARSVWKVPPFMEHAGYLAVAAIALATTGGLGAIFNIFVTPDIRAYNRISPWIAFFCLLAVAYVLDLLWEKLKTRRLAVAYVIFAAIVAVAGVLDQSPNHSPAFALSRQRVSEDLAWTRQIEAAVPAGAAILELPYADNYEGLPAAREQVPYLYSRGLRWSVGAFNGMRGAQFESQVAALPPQQMVPAALKAGFDGILIYRAFMPPKEAAFEDGLTVATHRAPIVSPDGGQALFPIYQLRRAQKP